MTCLHRSPGWSSTGTTPVLLYGWGLLGSRRVTDDPGPACIIDDVRRSVTGLQRVLGVRVFVTVGTLVQETGIR